MIVRARFPATSSAYLDTTGTNIELLRPDRNKSRWMLVEIRILVRVLAAVGNVNSSMNLLKCVQGTVLVNNLSRLQHIPRPLDINSVQLLVVCSVLTYMKLSYLS